MIPVIGISAEVDNEKDIKLKNTYVHAIEAAGGLPMVLPYTQDAKTMKLFAELCDGFLFTGGDDVAPERYGEQKKDTCGEIQYNRFTIATGAGCMILAGLLPPVGNFFASLPESVLGGCTIMMFGSIMVSGIEMLAQTGFTQRNVTIASLSLAIGIGFTSASEIDLWHIFPEVVQSVFSANVVAVVFVVSIVLNLILPKDMEIKKNL